jgi:hypothetical protein
MGVGLDFLRLPMFRRDGAAGTTVLLGPSAFAGLLFLFAHAKL